MLVRLSRRVALVLVLLLAAGHAFAADKLVISKAGTGMVYAAIDVGMAKGYFAQNGIDLTVINLPSAAAAFQAITGGTTDINLGAGTSMGFSLKGVPFMAVATLSGPPQDFVIAVDPNGPIKSIADLKGKNVAVTSAGAITWWFAKELGVMEGWGPDGVVPQTIGGGVASQWAALMHGEVQGIVTTPETATDYALRGQGKILMYFGDVIKTFQTHTIYASNRLREQRPDVLRRFLKAWFMSVHYMLDPAHRAECVKISADSIQISLSAADSVYDKEMSAMSLDGAFDPAAVDIVRKSLPESGILPEVPEARLLYDPSFVPVKLD